jgi:hypothetical protein
MGQEDDRSALISRIGTYFLLLGAILVILFIASDISRVDPGRIAISAQTATAQVPGLTQTYIVQGVQALQTRDAGAILAQQAGRATPTLVPIKPVNVGGSDSPINYISLFCLGTLIFGLGWYFKRITAKPAPPSKRFDIFRRMKESKAKREAAKAAKAAAKKDPKKKK